MGGGSHVGVGLIHIGQPDFFSIQAGILGGFRLQRTDESWLLHEAPWLFLKTEICSKRVPVQLAELLQTAPPVLPRWFLRVETERGHICDFMSPRLRAEEASYFSA